jgi:hypothetical protein
LFFQSGRQRLEGSLHLGRLTHLDAVPNQAGYDDMSAIAAAKAPRALAELSKTYSCVLYCSLLIGAPSLFSFEQALALSAFQSHTDVNGNGLASLVVPLSSVSLRCALRHLTACRLAAPLTGRPGSRLR